MKQENERAPVKYRRKSLISERTLTHTHKADYFALSFSKDTISFVAHRCARGVWSGGLIARMSHALEYRGIMQIGLVAGGWIFFQPRALVGVRLRVRLLQTRGRRHRCSNVSLCINCSTQWTRLCKSAASPCASYLFSRHFLHLICHGELAGST
jgi:hypothetical protein